MAYGRFTLFYFDVTKKDDLDKEKARSQRKFEPKPMETEQKQKCIEAVNGI